jgi:hypothetical protein
MSQVTYNDLLMVVWTFSAANCMVCGGVRFVVLLFVRQGFAKFDTQTYPATGGKHTFVNFCGSIKLGFVEPIPCF